MRTRAIKALAAKALAPLLAKARGRSRLGWLRVTWALVAVSVPAAAQNPPHVGYVLPAGGQQGTTVAIKVGGQFLANVSDVQVSGRGVLATVGEYARPMNPMQATELRDRMQELQKQTMTDAVMKEMVDIRTKLLLFNARRLVSPVLAETLMLEVRIAPDAPPGKRELRVLSPQGLSNPVVFYVGQLPEVSEQETIEVAQPPSNQPRPNPQAALNQLRLVEPSTNLKVTLPAVVNGRIKPGLPSQPGRQGQPFTPGESDRYRFEARKGQEIVITAAARDLIPYLADAVPGWFQAVLTLYDSAGKEVAYCDDYRFHPDPVVHFTVQKDGEYTVEIRDAIYRGREDFVYRLTIGELPYVTGIFPLGGPSGAKTVVEASGWNLPQNRITMDAAEKAPGVYPLYMADGGRVTNALPFQVDNLPEVLEREPNDAAPAAQRVKLPVVINGRIDKPGDQDVFSFEGRAGDVVVAEVFARRLESPLDSVLRLTDAKGVQIAFNDDCEDKGAGLETHHADSRIEAKLPAAGIYYLTIADVQQKGGPEFAYRLRIGAPRPDFELRVSPTSININPGQTVPVTVTALRRDGFAGGIAIGFKETPRGFAMTGAMLPAGQDSVRITVTAPPLFQAEPIRVAFEGRASIGGHEVVRTAVPAENMMQAFFYWHLVPETEEQLVFRRGNALRVPIQVSGTPLKIAAGGVASLKVRVVLPPSNVLENVQFELSDPPAGVELGGVRADGDATELTLKCNEKAKAGDRGNLIVAVSAERKPQPNAKGAANRQRVGLGTLPAVPYEVVGK